MANPLARSNFFAHLQNILFNIMLNMVKNFELFRVNNQDEKLSEPKPLIGVFFIFLFNHDFSLRLLVHEQAY